MGSGKFEAPSVLAAILLVAGCAQPSAPPQPRPLQSESGPAGSFFDPELTAITPTDHWYIGHPNHPHVANAVTMTESRDAVILAGCTRDSSTVAIYLEPKERMAGTRESRSLTMALDGGAPEKADWFDIEEAYGMIEFLPGFDATVEKLKTHHSVEFVIKDADREILRRTFTLNGADQALETILATCHNRT